MIVTLLIFSAGFGTVYFAGTIGVDECKVAAKEEKQRLSAERTKIRQSLEMFKNAAPGADTGTGATTAPKVRAKGTEGYENVFAPSNLEEDSKTEKQEEEKVESPGKSQFQNIFDPANLQQQSGSQDNN